MEGLIPDDWLTTIQLLGAVQGLFLAAVLAGSKSNRAANRVLAVAMAAFSVDLLVALLYARGLDQSYPHLIGVDFLLPFLYGPVFFVYAHSISEGGRRLPERDRWHFAPLALLLLVFVPFYLQSGAAKLALRADPMSSAWTPWLSGLNAVKLIYSFVYLALTYRVLRTHRRSVRRRYSAERRVALLWLRNMLIGGIALWALSAVLQLLWVLAGGGDPLEGFDDLVSVGLSAFVFAVGYLGLRQPELEPARTGRYERSGVDEDAVRSIASQAERAMTKDHLYRQPDLSLSQLADRLGVSPHNLSEALNRGGEETFYAFINRHRVRDVQRRLADPDNDYLTVLAIGEDAGFSSKSSFNSVFKRLAGVTPSEFRKAR